MSRSFLVGRPLLLGAACLALLSACAEGSSSGIFGVEGGGGADSSSDGGGVLSGMGGDPNNTTNVSSNNSSSNVTSSSGTTTSSSTSSSSSTTSSNSSSSSGGVVCGDLSCGAGEDSCSCPSDCADLVDSCSVCECADIDSGQACYCDSLCTSNGDCCANYTAVCGGSVDPADSCEPLECGGSGGNCFCDDLCIQAGDCCFNGPC